VVFCPFSGQKCASSDSKNRRDATEARRERGRPKPEDRGDDHRDDDTDPRSGPFDVGRWSSLRDAASLVRARTAIAIADGRKENRSARPTRIGGFAKGVGSVNEKATTFVVAHKHL
jgi:hypothetical protein